ncbi:hypothetical protein L218DRAFT_900707 [Marasmius fiardii PR-910]|nr:hypothetical protein L218DRAFT_900707 [Marasmius fiardii PR-910]
MRCRLIRAMRGIQELPFENRPFVSSLDLSKRRPHFIIIIIIIFLFFFPSIYHFNFTWYSALFIVAHNQSFNLTAGLAGRFHLEPL